jgi:hypothetical protein
MMFEDNSKHMGEFRSVRMFDGSKYNGKMIAENKNAVLIETRTIRIKLPKNQIVAILDYPHLMTAINVEIIEKANPEEVV